MRALSARHRRTLVAVFDRPTRTSIVFADIEALVEALGGAVTERSGSRVCLTLGDRRWYCHRPHPGKEARRYQVEEAQEFLEKCGVRP